VQGKLTRVVLLLRPNLNPLPYCLDLPSLPLSPADQTAKEKFRTGSR
jgi:hypothetical protein